jgi:hypothetical protein
VPRAARCTWWIGHSFLFRGHGSPARGWFGRGRKLLDRGGIDCVERVYLLFPDLLARSSERDYEGAYATAVEIGEIAERFGDADLHALALMEQGTALLKHGRREEGLRLVDETLVGVAAGELSAIVSGIVYCNTIAFCRDLYELRASREWTAALTRWCDRQPEMLAHQGVCLVHRAELMTLAGAWPDALAEARRVAEQFAQGALNARAVGDAFYRQGEVHRLRGDTRAAERAYRDALRLGREPDPGLSLLRLAQGKASAAAASIRRALAEADGWVRRAPLAPGGSRDRDRRGRSRTGSRGGA